MNNLPKGFIPEPFDYHQELELEITDLTNLGLGVGRYDGWVIMVRYALPGEKVRVRIFRNHKNYSEADLLEVVVPSSSRVVPPCPFFGKCGGCQYQNLSYEGQLVWKHKQVKSLFVKSLGYDVEVKPVHPSPRDYHYRSKITPHYDKPRKGEIGSIGFRHHSRNKIVDVSQCVIAENVINEKLPEFRTELKEKSKSLKKGGTMLIRSSGDNVTTDPKQLVAQQVGSVNFHFKAGDFFQNNPYILPDFVSHVIESAKGEGINYLIDAYCGSGLFALSASKHFKKSFGVEVNSSAVECANVNARLNGIQNCEFIIGQSEHIFDGLDLDPLESAMIVDPPRKGCDRAFLDQLVAFGPRKVVYVSCDPATQVRDIHYLKESGFSLLEVQPFDLFPQTRHIESVAILIKAR